MNKLETLIRDVSPDHPQTLIDLLHGIRDAEIVGTDISERSLLGRSMHAWMHAFCDPRFSATDDVAIMILQANTLISNVMSVIDATTDPWIQTLHGQSQQGFKTLALYSARNELEVDVKGLLDQNPALVSNWLYHTFQIVFSGMPNRKVVEKLRSFVHHVDERLIIGINMQEAYFGVTYTGDMLAERRMKELINNACRKVPKPEIVIDPDPKRIAVWAEYWSPGTSVHRSLRDYIAALKNDHHLTLLHSTKPADELDTSLFDEVVHLKMDQNGFDLSPLRDRNFAAVVFCDVGMTMPSILLSNVRLAPLQVMMTGHPVSTFGGEMDWFVSGELVEDVRVYGNDRFYSEKLLSLPGYGATHERPTYEPKGKKKDTDAVVINCSWLGQKCHYECLEALNRAIERSGQKVLVRMFPGHTPLMHKGAYAFMRDVQKVLSSPRVEMFPMLPYEQYMEIMEEGDFNVDCFPFGGSNTASDAIHLGKPLVSMSGNRWFNRIGPSMVENFCGYMGPETVQEYENEIVEMIQEDDYRELWLDQSRTNRDAVYEPRGAKEFNEWIKATVRKS